MLKTQIMAILLVVLLLILAACAPVPEAETPPISPPTEQQTYTLTITISPSETGSVFPSSGQYVLGLQVTLTATPLVVIPLTIGMAILQVLHLL